MRISVIIPTFNRAYCIERAIDSVLKQTYKEFDLWIIDDGSTDNTEEIVSKYENVHYIKSENRGVSAARNLGIEKSSGEWIALLDSDDEWIPEKLERQVELIKANPELPLIYGGEIWVRNGKRVNPKFAHKKYGGEVFNQCLPLCFIGPSASMIRRDVLEEMGGFDEEFTVCEDYDLWLKITSLYEVGFIEDPVIIKHGGHEDQLSLKYFAMDYWRIVAMDRITKIRDLSVERMDAVKAEITKKSKILIKGYIKHDNLGDDYKRIAEIAEKFDSTSSS